MPEPYQLTVAQAAERIRSKTLSPVELAQSLLDRIDRMDGELRAWVTIDREEVLSTARQREAEVEQGKPLGPVHGVPVGLKDIFYTAGMKTAAGSKVYAEFVPDFDATSVAKIKEAGGIILGKAVTTEFATSDLRPRAILGTRNTPPEAPAASHRRRWRPGWRQRPWVRKPAAPPVGRPRTTES